MESFKMFSWIKCEICIILFGLLITHTVSIDIFKCGVQKGSEIEMYCEDDKRIVVQSIQYYTYNGNVCNRADGNCYVNITEQHLRNNVCTGVYGRCNLVLDPTTLNKTCNNITSIAVDVNYECENASDGPKQETQCNVPNKRWAIDITCPAHNVIHVMAVTYWKTAQNKTCFEDKTVCIIRKSADQDGIYEKCRGAAECRHDLPNNIDTKAVGCNYSQPDIGADIQYRCLHTSDFEDICSNDNKIYNRSKLYLNSVDYLKGQGEYNRTECIKTIRSELMTVKILYLDLSQGGQITFYPHPRKTMDHNTVQIMDTVLYTNITDLTLVFQPNGGIGQRILIEFDAIIGTVQLDNANPASVPQASTQPSASITPSTVYSVTTGNTIPPTAPTATGKGPGGLIENPTEENTDYIIIGTVIGVIVLLILIIIIIGVIVFRRRRAKNKGSIYDGNDNLGYDQNYSVLSADGASMSSSIISGASSEAQPQSNISLSTLQEVDEDRSDIAACRIPDAQEALDDPNYSHIADYNQSQSRPVSVHCEPWKSLDLPKLEKVEYAKVVKSSAKKSELSAQYGSMYDNSFSNIQPPPEIPEKQLSVEEINDIVSANSSIVNDTSSDIDTSAADIETSSETTGDVTVGIDPNIYDKNQTEINPPSTSYNSVAILY